MKNLKSLEWWSAAGTRAIKTFCQTLIAAIGTTAVLGGVDWVTALSMSLLAALLSILTSIAGLPEVDKEIPALDDKETHD